MKLYRIADKRFPIWNGDGAASIGGRWNSPGRPVIYASTSYACAMLEILVHANIGRIPTTQCYVVVDVPSDVSIEQLDTTTCHQAWQTDDTRDSRKIGDDWLMKSRSAVLLVPSVIAKHEWNALVNPAHPDAVKLRTSEPEPVIWDARLFKQDPQR